MNYEFHLSVWIESWVLELSILESIARNFCWYFCQELDLLIPVKYVPQVVPWRSLVLASSPVPTASSCALCIRPDPCPSCNSSPAQARPGLGGVFSGSHFSPPVWAGRRVRVWEGSLPLVLGQVLAVDWHPPAPFPTEKGLAWCICRLWCSTLWNSAL